MQQENSHIVWVLESAECWHHCFRRIFGSKRYVAYLFKNLQGGGRCWMSPMAKILSSNLSGPQHTAIIIHCAHQVCGVR